MALAVLATGFLRALLPDQLRVGNRWLLLVIIVFFLCVLVIGEPHIGRICPEHRRENPDRQQFPPR